MIIKYTPFSESIALNKEIRGLDFADSAIKPYFLMSLHYHDSYYREQPEGNTIYFMNFPDCSLLFYFSASIRSHYINGFRIQAKDRQKAWLSMLSLIESLRKYPFSAEAGKGGYDRNFLENIADLTDAMLDELVPFHFIVSSMPEKCFPKCREMRLFNQFCLDKTEKSYHLVTKNQMRQVTMPLEDYDLVSQIFWVPAPKVSKKWRLEYYTGIIEKEGRNKGKYRVVNRETNLPGSQGQCTYKDLMTEIMRMVQEDSVNGG